MVFGKDASPRVWMVLDGNTLYVDRNGNGDLTETDEKVSLKTPNTDPASFDSVEVRAGDNVTRKLDVFVYNWLRRPDEKDRALQPCLTITDGKQRTYGVWGGWDSSPAWSTRPESAPIFHIGGPLEMGFEQPANLVFTKKADRTLDLQVGVGTPGLGKGAFTHLKYWNDAIPEKLQPTALLEFPNKVRGGPPVKMEFALKERC
jgi:hypothetical protein